MARCAAKTAMMTGVRDTTKIGFKDWNSSAEIAMPNKFKSVYSLAKYVSVNPF